MAPVPPNPCKFISPCPAKKTSSPAEWVCPPEQAARQQDVVHLDELLVREADVVTALSDPHSLQHTRVAQLAAHGGVVEPVRVLMTWRERVRIRTEEGGDSTCSDIKDASGLQIWSPRFITRGRHCFMHCLVSKS